MKIYPFPFKFIFANCFNFILIPLLNFNYFSNKKEKKKRK
jgi:hypothetical protein